MSDCKRTIKELLDTINPDGNPQIYCPRCGTPLSLRIPGGVQPVLSAHSREHLNEHLVLFRQTWLCSEILDALNQLNDGVASRAPLQEELLDDERLAAIVKTPIEAADIWPVRAEGRRQTGPSDTLAKAIETLSPGSLRQLILQKVPVLAQLEQKPSPSESSDSTFSPDPLGIAEVISAIVLSIEKSDLYCSTLNIVTDEPRVRNWIQAVRRTQRDVHAFLHSLCPPEAHYLMRYLELAEKWVANKDYFDEQLYPILKNRELARNRTKNEIDCSGLQQSLQNRCERAAFLTTLLVMHMTERGRDELREHFGSQGRLSSGSGAYLLPDVTAVTYESMKWLMQSLEVSEYDILRVRTEYRDVLEYLRTDPRRNAEGPSLPAAMTDHDWFVRVMQDERVRKLFSKVFGFGCKGPPPQFPGYHDADTSTSGEEMTPLKGICGWFPKEEETRTILLIGSPGCGKSNAFGSGAAGYLRAMDRKTGFVNRFSPMSDMLIQRIQQAVTTMKEPSRTERCSYHALEFTLHEEEGQRRKSHFILTDIPGELATQRLRDGESAPIVRQTLRQADVVVVFFDLTIDPLLAARIETSPQRDLFTPLIEQREKTRRARMDDVAAGNSGAESVADVVQFQLLDSIVAECLEGRANQRMPELILVIPKADLLANPDAEPQSTSDPRHNADRSPLIMQHVFNKAAERRTLITRSTGHSTVDGRLKWRTSNGVRIVQQPATDPMQAFIQQVCNEMRQLSECCEEALGRIGNIVRPKNSGDAVCDEADMLNEAMTSRIAGLKRVFANVHLLPVSAQGKPAVNDEHAHHAAEVDFTSGEELQQRLGYPRKFCEFLILGPAMMLLNKAWFSTVQQAAQQTPAVSQRQTGVQANSGTGRTPARASTLQR